MYTQHPWLDKASSTSSTDQVEVGALTISTYKKKQSSNVNKYQVISKCGWAEERGGYSSSMNVNEHL